jgi:hypothetical protein
MSYTFAPVLVIEDDGAFVAVRLDHICSAQGDNFTQAMERLANVCELLCRYGGIETLPQASAKWWSLYADAEWVVGRVRRCRAEPEALDPPTGDPPKETPP